MRRVCAGLRAGPICLATVLALATVTAAAAAGEPDADGEPGADSRLPDVPGGVFGFSDSAGVGDPGEQEFGVTIDGAFAKRNGSYTELSKKYVYERVIAPRTSVEVALFTVYHSIRNVTAIAIAGNGIKFNGAAFELAYQLVQRAAGNPFAVKLAVEPRWSRIDGDGRNAAAGGVELKLAIDAPITARLFWAANAQIEVERGRVAGMREWETESSIKLSTALAYAVSQSVFLGAELTYRREYEGFIGRFAGHSLFLGPTLRIKLTDKAALSATFAPQIAGKAAGAPGRLDLDGATRYIARLKFGLEF